MKRIFYFVVLLIALFISTTHSIAQSWQLVWQDEFTNGIGPDWVFETGTGTNGWGNNELQYYRTQNATVQNGQLVITARNESFGGRNYTSARLKTQGRKSWKYGKIEARIAMPAFQGVWPAFWMLGTNIGDVGWPACGEIDIMEHVNAENRTYGTIHWQVAPGQNTNYGGNTAVNVTAFHVYTIEWTASSIKWFVDGAQFHEANIANSINGTNEFHNNFFIILNMAIGGNWPGFTVNNGAMPANMYVDYVKVYQQVSGPSSVTIQAENYSNMLGVQTEACTDDGGGQNVGYIDATDWVAYNSINFPTSGSYLVEYRVASQNGGGTLSLDLNAGSIQLGSLGVPSTGGWQNWTTISHTVNVANAGTYNVGVYAQAGGWNLNWIRITKQGSSLLTSNTLDSKEVQSEEADNNFTLFPNPVKDELRIATGKNLAGGLLRIYDIMGRQVFIATQATNRVNVAKLPTGVYTLLFTKDGKTISRRFIK